MFPFQMPHLHHLATKYHFTTMGITQRVNTFTWNFLSWKRHCVTKSAKTIKPVQDILMTMTQKDAF